MNLSTIHEQYPGYLLAVERDSMYWLYDQDVDRARPILKIEPRRRSIGYFADTFRLDIAKLIAADIPVAILSNGSVRLATIIPPKQSVIAGTPIDLAPRQLYNEKELRSIVARVKHRQRLEVESVSERLEREGYALPLDMGKLYVYRDYHDDYHVDTATSVCSKVLDVLVAIAVRDNRTIRCECVLPKPWRTADVTESLKLGTAEAVWVYSQLTLCCTDIPFIETERVIIPRRKKFRIPAEQLKFA